MNITRRTVLAGATGTVLGISGCLDTDTDDSEPDANAISEVLSSIDSEQREEIESFLDQDEFSHSDVLRATDDVTITATTSFNPLVVSIPVYTQVRWESDEMDIVIEDVDSNGDMFSYSIPVGSSQTHEFPEPGVYKYHSAPHHTLGLKGVIIVTS